jgi:uncharacterized membrane protein YgdD (TMEM256/DUF423 family)
MQRILVALAGFYGFVAVLMAALASHLLAKHIDAASLDIVKTGINIEAWHALALLIVGLEAGRLGKWGLRAGALWAFGIFLFCGAVYWRGMMGSSLGGVAPVGGISLMLGWLMLLWGGVRGF